MRINDWNEAWSLSSKRVGQLTPKKATSYSGIRPQTGPDFAGTLRPVDESDDEGDTK